MKCALPTSEWAASQGNPPPRSPLRLAASERQRPRLYQLNER